MNLDKLKTAEAEFFAMYPGGFGDEALLPIVKRHHSAEIGRQVETLFAENAFGQPDEVCDNFAKIVSKSSMISFFEKPRVRDMVKGMSPEQKDMLSIALYELLHGNEKEGFEGLVEVLSYYKLAKWSLVSMLPYYYNRRKAFFIKPTTTKNILKHFEIGELVYKPRPAYAFYKGYSKVLNEMKKRVDPSLGKDNAAFTGFLMMAMGMEERRHG
ncbi:hypothetical protein [Sulfurimonas diazotrophicus]|uniref:Uncharacterized protein n=1 Tax=Sulfurimonas diazotrophicus TaxID=3131939 RepID=A0ABZ3HCP3_9BACT